MTINNNTMTQLSLGINSAIPSHNKLEPREYQTSVKKDLYRLFNQKIKKVLLVAPTGSGKTIISTDIISDATTRKKKVLFLIHRDVLAEQTAKTLQNNGIDCGFIMGSKRANESALVQIASVQTMARRKSDYIPDIVFYDEAHLTAWSSYGRKLLKEDIFHIGLTATPWRLKTSEGMGDLFDELIHTPLPYELMDMGFLVYPRYFVLEKPDLKGIKIVGGDYNSAQLNSVCNVQPMIDNLIENWLNIAKGKRTIIFAVNVAHAKNIAHSFREKEITAEAVYGDMPLKEREIIYEKLEKGEIKVIASCEALAEGFDVPSIECVALSRPTKSKAKFFQQVGRGLRISKNKDSCFILDQAGLIESFGAIEDLRSVELTTGVIKEKGNKSFCECCGRGLPSGMKICAKCSPEKEVTLVMGKMVELVIEKGIKRNFDWYRARIKEAFQKGYSPGWALYKYKEHYDKFPDKRWGLNSVFGDEPSSLEKTIYLNYLTAIAKNKSKSVTWIRQQYSLQFGEEVTGEIKLTFSQTNMFEIITNTANID
jgi:superfamily II DNA or RNA helicase